MQATFDGDQLETEAPTAGDNEADVEGKKTEQEPTQKDTKADASLLFFLELLKQKSEKELPPYRLLLHHVPGWEAPNSATPTSGQWTQAARP